MLLDGGLGADDVVTGLLSTIQPVLEYLGTIAFALSGAFAAGRRRMDIGGVVVLGAIVAVGGGTIRDALLNLTVFWVADPTFLAVGVVAALGAIPLMRYASTGVQRNYWLIEAFDAAGLALFVVIGTNIALDSGATLFAAATIGIISGIGGGILRDVLAGQIPTVLSDGRLYMTAALAGAASYLLLLQLPVPPVAVFWIPVVIIFGLRLFSLRYNVSVPRFILGPKEDPRQG